MGLALLTSLLLLAVWHDVKYHRIPNWLVGIGMLAALVLHATLPSGLGLVSAAPGGLGSLGSLKGLTLGLALLLPFYLLRAMGAGDVKLMAMAGAFLGATDVFWAAIATFLAGGVLALAVAVKEGVIPKMMQNIRIMIYSGVFRAATGGMPTFEEAPKTAARLPYAVAIAVGTLGYLIYKANNVGFFEALQGVKAHAS